MLVVVCVAIIVVGPKDLPKMLRAFGRTMKSVRGLASDFQKQFEEAIKDTELDEVKKLASGKGFSPLEDIKKSATAYEKHVKDQIEGRANAVEDAKTQSVDLPEPVSVKGEASTSTVAAAEAPNSNPTLANPAPSRPAASKTVAARKAAGASSAAKKTELSRTASKPATKAPAKAAARPAGAKAATAKPDTAVAGNPAYTKASAAKPAKSTKPAGKPSTGKGAKTA